MSELVGQYCWGLVPGMWPLVLVLIKYLQVRVDQRRHRQGSYILRYNDRFYRQIQSMMLTPILVMD